MDSRGVQWSQARYNEIQQEVQLYCKRVGFAPGNIRFVPISAYQDENISTRSPNMPWWKGPTFMEAVRETVLSMPRWTNTQRRIELVFFLFSS
jgi:translation elongation factor EF-1alpha